MLEVVEVGKVCSIYVPRLIIIAVYVSESFLFTEQKSNLCVDLVFASIMNKEF